MNLGSVMKHVWICSFGESAATASFCSMQLSISLNLFCSSTYLPAVRRILMHVELCSLLQKAETTYEDGKDGSLFGKR